MQPRKDFGYESGFSRFVPWVLGVAIAASAVVTMWFGRGVSFTGDELTWVVASPGMDLDTALMTHGGHLQLIPRVVYKIMLETIGLVYWPYRLLTVIAMAVAAILLYRYLVKRVGPMVALVPCLIMLFFGSDALHVIQGNGFTIILTVICGLGAFLALDRRDTRGDVAACVLLVCGAATYTTALPFIAGVVLLLLLERSWRRLWIPAVPLVLFGLWRVWLASRENSHTGSSLHLENLTEVPRWCFDALSAVLSSVTGFGYGVTGLSTSGPNEVMGPALAVLAIAAIAWGLWRAPVKKWIWVTLAIAVALWAIQCLAADFSTPAFRAPDDPRYLYPGAIVVFMIGAELVSGRKWSNLAYAALVAVGLFGLVSNIAQMQEYGNKYRFGSDALVLQISVFGIYLDELSGHRVEAGSDPVVVYGTAQLLAAIAARPYGGVDYSEKEILALDEPDREAIDRSLASAFKIALAETTRRATGCRLLRAEPGAATWEAPLPPGEAVVIGDGRAAAISVGRFGGADTVPVGKLPANARRELTTPQPILDTHWRIASTEPGVKVCDAS